MTASSRSCAGGNIRADLKSEDISVLLVARVAERTRRDILTAEGIDVITT